MSYMDEFDDGAAADFGQGGTGIGGYPILNGIIWYFRISAAITALLSVGAAFGLDKGVLGFVVTLVAGFAAAAIQLVISEVISVFVDTAKNTKASASELEQIARDMSTVRQRVEDVVNG